MKPAILVVDNNKNIRRMIMTRLTRLGYSVEVAENGIQALDILKSKHIDLVLLDQQMPDMDGITTLGEIRKKFDVCLPVIMVTASSSLNLAILFMKSGGTDFVEKPIDFDILHVKILRAIKTAKQLQNEIAERQKAEETLRENKEILHSTLGSLDDLLLIIDKKGTIVDFYQPPQMSTPYSLDLLKGENIRESFSPETSVLANKMFTEMSISGDTQQLDWSLEEDGKIRWFDIRIAPRTDSKGDFAGATLYMRDISWRKETEERLEQYSKQLELTNIELKQFSYIASHDLREPLRKVKSFTELLAKRYEGQLDERAEKYINYIVDGADRMDTLISDLLTFSQVGLREQDFESVDLNKTVERVLGDISPLIEESQTQITSDLLPTVRANQTQMNQLLQNLLSNAIKFRDVVPPHIHIGVRQEDESWLFWVKDNGIGFDPEFAEHIFRIFQRLRGQGTYIGTGIGLAICKKIMDVHNGRIWAESQIGEGATFYFSLPLTQPSWRFK